MVKKVIIEVINKQLIKIIFLTFIDINVEEKTKTIMDKSRYQKAPCPICGEPNKVTKVNWVKIEKTRESKPIKKGSKNRMLDNLFFSSLKKINFKL